MKTIVIYGGRFHPFHKGHKSVYDGLVKKFGQDAVIVATSGKQAPGSSPFSFEDKTKMMTLLGVPRDKIVQVITPYNPKEVTDKVNGEEYSIVFAVSEKDAERFSFKPKKDGSPSYMQPMTDDRAPLSKHGYVMVVPTIDFDVAGKPVKSASEIRAMYLKSNDNGRKAILKSLYGKAPAALKKLFDTRLSLTEQYLRMVGNKRLIAEGKNAAWLAKARVQEAKIKREEWYY